TGVSLGCTTHHDRLCRGGGMTSLPLSASPGPPCHILSRSDLHMAGSNELKRDLTRPAPFQQIFDRAAHLLVKRSRGVRFDVKTRQFAVIDEPDPCLGIPCGPDGDTSTHLWLLLCSRPF